MAFDEDLAERIRALVATEPGVHEKRMFGGLAFLVNGNLAVSASGQGGLLLRAEPGRSAEYAAKPGVSVAVMRGREMAGWLRVDADSVRTDKQLRRWVEISVGYARSLPAK